MTRNGYSLLELLFAIAAVATLSGIAVPPVLAALDDQRTAGAARYMAARIQRIRMEAVSRSTNVALRFVPTASGYWFRVYIDGDGDGVHTDDTAIVGEAGPLPPIIVHGFVGSAEVARAWSALGATLSFGGDVLRSERTLDVAARWPRDAMLLESDAPHGFAGDEASTPALVVAVAGAIATRACIPRGELARVTAENADRLFFRA